MNLKSAAAVCLISLFSATLVMLMARALDLQTASKLEPQLTKIAEELAALRGQAPIMGAGHARTNSHAVDDGLMVYYFHGKIRCATCQAIESQTHEAVQADFGAELKNGGLVWRILNYEDPQVAELAATFQVQMPVVVLARMTAGTIEEWKRLDQVWALVGDQAAFRDFVSTEIGQMLRSRPQSSAVSRTDRPEIPVPAADSVDLPVPTPSLDLPGPE